MHVQTFSHDAINCNADCTCIRMHVQWLQMVLWRWKGGGAGRVVSYRYTSPLVDCKTYSAIFWSIHYNYTVTNFHDHSSPLWRDCPLWRSFGAYVWFHCAKLNPGTYSGTVPRERLLRLWEGETEYMCLVQSRISCINHGKLYRILTRSFTYIVF